MACPKRQARKDRVGPGFSRVSKKDKPEKTGRVGAAKKDKPEKTGRVGSAEIGGKTGSGRVRVGVDPTLVEPLVTIAVPEGHFAH